MCSRAPLAIFFSFHRPCHSISLPIHSSVQHRDRRPSGDGHRASVRRRETTAHSHRSRRPRRQGGDDQRRIAAGAIIPLCITAGNARTVGVSNFFTARSQSEASPSALEPRRRSARQCGECAHRWRLELIHGAESIRGFALALEASPSSRGGQGNAENARTVGVSNYFTARSRSKARVDAAQCKHGGVSR